MTVAGEPNRGNKRDNFPLPRVLRELLLHQTWAQPGRHFGQNHQRRREASRRRQRLYRCKEMIDRMGADLAAVGQLAQWLQQQPRFVNARVLFVAGLFVIQLMLALGGDVHNLTN